MISTVKITDASIESGIWKYTGTLQEFNVSDGTYVEVPSPIEFDPVDGPYLVEKNNLALTNMPQYVNAYRKGMALDGNDIWEFDNTDAVCFVKIKVCRTFTTSAISAGSFTVTPDSMLNINLNDNLNIDWYGPNASHREVVSVTAVTSSTFTATFAFSHTPDTITGYNIQITGAQGQYGWNGYTQKFDSSGFPVDNENVNVRMGPNGDEYLGYISVNDIPFCDLARFYRVDGNGLKTYQMCKRYLPVADVGNDNIISGNNAEGIMYSLLFQQIPGNKGVQNLSFGFNNDVGGYISIGRDAAGSTALAFFETFLPFPDPNPGTSPYASIKAFDVIATDAFVAAGGALAGVTGTSGGNDTVTGGIITSLGAAGVSGTITVVTSVNFGASTVTTKTVTVTHGRITNIV